MNQDVAGNRIEAMSTRPLVTVMIATRDRSPELQRTLEILRTQQYTPLEVVVVDDGSREAVEPVVRKLWPDAVVIRHENSQGQCQRRNEGFAASSGEFILQLDDDCCFTQPGDLDAAVRWLSARPRAAGVIFDLFNGAVMPEGLPDSSALPGCVASFVGAAILLRGAAVRNIAGYRSFFQGQREEEEFALQLLDKGWQILYCPTIRAHHRLSDLNRDSLSSWRRGLRNDIWTRTLHVSILRLPLEIGWTLLVGMWDMIRLARFRGFCNAVWDCLFGLGRVWRLRQPFSPIAQRRYDALRFRSVLTEAEFENPPGISASDLRSWWSRWRRRARDRNAWETGVSTTGSSHTVRYAHEFPMTQDASSKVADSPKPARAADPGCAMAPGGASHKPGR
jgi:GT2 family glycosyltransferase